jgi:hypothetical protein
VRKEANGSKVLGAVRSDTWCENVDMESVSAAMKLEGLRVSVAVNSKVNEIESNYIVYCKRVSDGFPSPPIIAAAGNVDVDFELALVIGAAVTTRDSLGAEWHDFTTYHRLYRPGSPVSHSPLSVAAGISEVGAGSPE